jgi:hypothetical protein
MNECASIGLHFFYVSMASACQHWPRHMKIHTVLVCRQCLNCFLSPGICSFFCVSLVLFPPGVAFAVLFVSHGICSPFCFSPGLLFERFCFACFARSCCCGNGCLKLALRFCCVSLGGHPKKQSANIAWTAAFGGHTRNEHMYERPGGPWG